MHLSWRSITFRDALKDDSIKYSRVLSPDLRPAAASRLVLAVPTAPRGERRLQRMVPQEPTGSWCSIGLKFWACFHLVKCNHNPLRANFNFDFRILTPVMKRSARVPVKKTSSWTQPFSGFHTFCYGCCICQHLMWDVRKHIIHKLVPIAH